MNIPELKVFTLNNTDVITASGPIGPVTTLGYHFGGFFDNDENESYFLVKSDGKLEHFASADNAAAATHSQGFFEKFELTESDRVGLVDNSYFSITGKGVIQDSIKSRPSLGLLTLEMYEASELFVGEDSAETALGSLADFFQTHLWTYTVDEKNNVVFFTNPEDTYSFDEDNKEWSKEE